MLYQEKPEKKILSKLILAFGGILAGFIIMRIIIVPFSVPDDSMEPNLRKGDTVFILKHVTPDTGDIVLIESTVESSRVMIRRVAASEGDSVEIREKAIQVNGQATTFPWKTSTSDRRAFPMSFTYRDTMPAIKIERKHYFVLCDNLDRGYDSRTLGIIPADRIIGRLLYAY
ncbi:MAG: signal peptidase I [Chrysiogenales bacterium]|nr:MAG: signal peptidase I [Chrysiogenales bacterium]